MLSFFLVTSFIMYLILGFMWSMNDFINFATKIMMFILAFIAAYLIFTTRALGEPTIPTSTSTIENVEQ